MKKKNKNEYNTYHIDGYVFISTYDYVYKPIYFGGKKSKYIVDRRGNVYNKKSKKRKTPVLSSGGYYRVQLSERGMKPQSFAIHRLVASAFIDNPYNKPDVNHKDGVKSHNCVSNLEWVTKSENVLHAFKNNLNSNKGELNPKSKLNEEMVKQIWSYINDPCNSLTFSQIGDLFGVSKPTISHINRGDTWKELYNIYKNK